MILQFIDAIEQLVTREKGELALQMQNTGLNKVKFQQLIPKVVIKRKSKRELVGPRVIFRMVVRSITLELKGILTREVEIDSASSQREPAKESKFHQNFDNVTADFQAFSFRLSNQTFAEFQEKDYQVSLGWVEISATSKAGSYKLLVYPNGDQEQVSVIEKKVLSLVPALEPAQDGDRVSFLDMAIVTRNPCPFDAYGKEFRLSMKRLEIVLYEDILEGLLDSMYRLKTRVSGLQSIEDFFGGLPTLEADNNSSSSLLPISARPSTSTISAQSPPGSNYSSFFCLVNINGPTAYFIPSGLLRPVLKLHFTTLFISGDQNLPMPAFEMSEENSKPLCYQKEKAEFPAHPTDFTNRVPQPGDNRESTKLMAIISPASLFFLSEDGEHALVRVPEVHMGLNWDNTATPQFQATLAIPEIL